MDTILSKIANVSESLLGLGRVSKKYVARRNYLHLVLQSMHGLFQTKVVQQSWKTYENIKKELRTINKN